MKCIKCGNDITDEMLKSGLCFQCGENLEETLKQHKLYQEQMEKEERIKRKLAKDQNEVERIKQQKNQEVLDEKLHKNQFINEHMLTTGYQFEGYEIESYYGLVSGETVIGTGLLSSIDASISDLFGGEATEYTQKMKIAKQVALDYMIRDSIVLGANAIIGITYTFITFESDMIGISVNGTSVKIKKKIEEKG